MAEKPTYPRLRTVDKVKPPFPLNEFPKDFSLNLGREIVYLLATKGNCVLEGPEWEAMFASCIGAKWKPSNVGLDDIVLDSCAWGAKTVKGTLAQKTIRLISGRNSPTYSFQTSAISGAEPNALGTQVLSIWNERVSAVRKHYKHLRTVVMIKSEDLSELAVFEFDTIRYDPELFIWKWNDNSNLVGFEKLTKKHRFTWQPHGSQFTIIEEVPNDALTINIKVPSSLDKKVVLSSVGFDKSWVKTSRRGA